MKRGKPLPRRTPLSPGQKPLRRVTPLTSTSGLRNTKPLERTELVSKRPTVTPAERKSRAIVRERCGGSCERCGRAPAVEYAHRRARSQGGAWCPTNAIMTCSPCHRTMHSQVAISYQQGWHVRSTQDPAVVPAWLAGRGLVYLRADGSVNAAERAA